MATCRCSMCGGKNAGKNKNKGIYTRYNVGQDEFGRYWDFGRNKKKARKLLRTRMNRELRNLRLQEC